MLKLILSVLSVASLSTAQDAPSEVKVGKLNVSIECVFRYTSNATCQDFKNLFYRQYEHIVNRAESNADLNLHITDEERGTNSVSYAFIWTSRLPNTMSGPFILPLVLNKSLDNLGTLNQLVQNAGKGLLVYYQIESGGVDPNGTVVVVYTSPKASESARGKEPGFFDRLEKSPWLFSAEASGFGNRNGIGNLQSSFGNFSGEVGVGYFREKFKVDFSGHINRARQSVPDGEGGQIKASNTNREMRGLVVYALSKNWNVAVIETVTTNPGANINFQNETKVGLEWILVPFRTTENRELAFRVGNMFSTIDLLRPNDRDHMTEKFMTAFAEISFYWAGMGDKLTMSILVDAGKNLKYRPNYGVFEQGSLNYQITRSIGVGTTVFHYYSPRSLTYPKNPDFSNPLMSSFLSGQPGGGFGYNFNVTFRFGNSVKKNRDRRWSHDHGQ